MSDTGDLPAPPLAKSGGGGKKTEERIWHEGIGAQISYKEHVQRDGSFYFNYTIKCNRCDKALRCEKTMGRTPGNVKKFGEVGILAYLHSWLTIAEEEGKTHQGTNSSKAQAVAYEAANEEKLKQLFEKLTGES